MKEGSKPLLVPTQLQPGQFYGQVAQKRVCAQVVLSELRHETRRKLPEHSHQLSYFCLLLSGEYSEHLGQKSYAYSPLTVMFHPPGLTHWDEVGAGGGHFFSIELETSWIERLQEHAIVPTVVTPTQAGDLTWLGMRLFREFRQPDFCSPLAVEGLVMAMLADVTRIRLHKERQKPAWLSQAMDLIHDQFSENLTIAGIASEVDIHPFHLSKVFRQFNHQSIGEFLNRLRIQFACRELANPERRLAEIAFASGFADQSHFTRVFKERTGMTPGAFRSSLHGKA
jgi:AraC family transcriptional regulator